MTWGSRANAGYRATMLRPFRMAAALTIVAMIMSLGFLSYMAWASGNRLDPLVSHLSHLNALQQSSVDIQELIIRHFEEQTDPQPGEITRISKQLKASLESGAYLHPDTPNRIRQAAEFVEYPQGNIKAGLLAALALIRQTIAQESELQRIALVATRRSANAELVVATTALLVVPAIALIMLVYLRRRTFASINQLSGLLENVGNLNFRSTGAVAPDDPFAGIYERYNDMTDRLRQAAQEADDHASKLESQVRAASETLLKQQAEFEANARLAAIGEFSARLAHELRNPISGISVALHNLEAELSDDDHKERIALMAEEMDRVTRLLNASLATSPSKPEVPTRIHTASLIDDVIRLFSYQLPPQVTISSEIEEHECLLPRDTIRQVLINLLKNACEAIGPNAGEIIVTVHRVGERFTLTVADSGPGYPEDLLKYGIRPFQSGKTFGTGLGLSIIKRLVNAAGGDIRLANGSHGGAHAVVTLPCKD